RRPSHLEPLAVDFSRQLCIHCNVAVSIFARRSLDSHPLMPAMHSADGIGMHRESEILMHTGLAPEDALRIGIVAFEGLYVFDSLKPPPAIPDFLEIHKRRCPSVRAFIALQSPPAEMVRAPNHTRPYPFGDPRPDHKVSDVGVDSHQRAVLDAQ